MQLVLAEFSKSFLRIFQEQKAEAPCPGATGIRRAGEKVAFYLLDGLAYDPEPLGAGARFNKGENPLFLISTIGQTLRLEVAAYVQL
jgi:hypothetical protein